MLAPRYLCSRWLGTIPAALAGVAVYVIWVRHHSEGMTGGSTPGLWFGLLGFGCMVWTFAMLPVRRGREKNGKASGPRSIWLRGHLWIALLGTVFILCHTGFVHWGGRLEIVLMVVLYSTLATGFYGLHRQHYLPRKFLSDGPGEVPLCQLSHLCRNWVRQADELEAATREHLVGTEASKQEFQRIYLKQVLPFLRDHWPVQAALVDSEQGPTCILATVLEERDRTGQQANLDKLRDICRERERLLTQQRLHRKLHGWLLVHVPLAIVLVILGAVHAFVSIWM